MNASEGTLRVTVNGEPREIPAGATVAWLVDDLGAGRRGVAVAIDAEVVVRSGWDTIRLQPGARIEVLRAVQGGC